MLRVDIAKKFPYRDWCLHNFDGDLWIRLLIAGNELRQRNFELVRYRILDGERNMGADTLANTCVWWAEKRTYLRNFLRVSAADARKLFAGLEPNSVDDSALRPLMVAAWLAEHAPSPYLRSLGVSFVYELLEDEEFSRLAESTVGFTVHSRLRNIAASADPYNLALARRWHGRAREATLPPASLRTLAKETARALGLRFFRE
jgi:hypothetical protein